MSANRIDWPSIKETIAASGYTAGEPFLFVLPHAGRHLLLAIAQRLEWEATYRDKAHGYDFSDWDELQAIVAEVHHGLSEMEQVNRITEKLEEIRYELQLMREQQATQNTEDELEGITSILALYDPKLALLVEGVNAIENVMGGSWEPTP